MQKKASLFFLFILFIASCRTEQIPNSSSTQNLHVTNIPELDPTLTVQVQEDFQNPEISSPSQEEINALLLEENREEFVITSVNLTDELTDSMSAQIENSIVVNSNKTFEAFTFCVDSCQIFYRIVGNEIAHKIEAPYFLKRRPFINIRWSETYVLEFYQSSQPNHATSYSVNVQTGTLENVQSIFSPPSLQEP